MNNLEKEQYAVQQELLSLLGELQRNTAPIEISIGYTNKNNIVCSGVVIKSAPPVVATKLVEQGYYLDIMKDGVHVSKF